MENTPFWTCCKGMDVVNLIDHDIMKKVTILKGEAAKKFDDVKVFYDFFS
jgi:peptidylprolyl isomerase